uniref:Uncharacterized protein n=1 Tax=Nelumbo nucifera TaxID=4432 RepID=A0A822ZL43_NELNU|nr:TPA_asm: hypothetical protein HUJ06_001926 [Nelumbo nucifera]
MDWCGSSTPRTPEYQTMNEEGHERKAYWLVIVKPQFLTGGDTKGLCPFIPWIDREGGQSFCCSNAHTGYGPNCLTTF